MNPSAARPATGDALPDLVIGPVTRAMLAHYAGGSGDYNPIHLDSDAARAAGLEDVIAHGMLSMAWLARVVTQAMPGAALRSFSTRFTAMTPVGARVICTGQIAGIFTTTDGEPRARVALRAQIEGGAETLIGEAVVALAEDDQGNVHEKA